MSKMRRRVSHQGPFHCGSTSKAVRSRPGPGALIFHFFSLQPPVRGGRLRRPLPPGKRSFPIDRSPRGRAGAALAAKRSWAVGGEPVPAGHEGSPQGSKQVASPSRGLSAGGTPACGPLAAPGWELSPHEAVPSDPEAPRLVPGPPAWPDLAPARRPPLPFGLAPRALQAGSARSAPGALGTHAPSSRLGRDRLREGRARDGLEPAGRPPRGGSAHPGTRSPPPALWCQAAG